MKRKKFWNGLVKKREEESVRMERGGRENCFPKLREIKG
jgi:hypothetical protein